MSITSALNSAASGLRATSVQTDMVSKNISNANKEGYTRKDAKLETIQGNVKVATIDRQVSSMLDKLDRTNMSKVAARETVAEGVKAYTDYLGQPEDASSPSALLADLRSSLIGFSGAVSDGATQLSVISSAKAFASQINSLSDTVDTVAGEVEMNIRYDVSELNSALYEVAKINNTLISAHDGSATEAQLKDDMDQVLDTIAGIMDVQTRTDKNGMVSILTSGGTELLVGKEVFDVAYDGATGTLTAGTVDITPGGATRAFSHGSLNGLFELKNQALPGFSAQLDAMAAATIERFEASAPITADGRGLFTDAGLAFNAAATPGLASRIAVNPDADPDQGGDASILQDGQDPTVPSGDNSLAMAMVNLFNDPIGVPSAGLGAGLTLTKMSSTLTSAHQGVRVDAEQSRDTLEAAAATISASRQNLSGVNIDDELQKLMLIERSYAANAKVLTTVGRMLDSLIESV